MKKNTFLLLSLISFTFFISCNDKKLTEVVEVPLPTVQEKVTLGNPNDVKANEGSFQLEKLPFAYDALSPNIGALTLEGHYGKHYLNYTNNLNKAILGTKLENLSIVDILKKLDLNDASIRNNAGGYYNHTLYFKCLSPTGGDAAKDTLASAINKNFGSFSNFKTVFSDSANKLLGSGWAWLIVDNAGQLQIVTTQNQDNPLMPTAPVVGSHGTPILGIDLWEHSYFLDYQYKRKDYINAFFTVINWEKVNDNYKATFKK